MKYNITFCKCGRIHAIENKKIEDALEENKDFLLICANCGAATIIGADITPDWDEPSKNCYMMYSRDLSSYKDAEITQDAFKDGPNQKAIKEILYSHGYAVPMMSGNNATDFFSGGRFSDRWYPDFYKIQRDDITVKEIMQFIDKFNDDRTTVNMDRFIYNTPDDVLEELSHYSIDGFDWSGTKFQKKK